MNYLDAKSLVRYNTIICAAFCGSGKTYICERTHIKSIEIEYWKYKDKGLIEEYMGEINKHMGNVAYIFISTDPEGLKLLHRAGFNIVLVYPRNDLRNEYLDRFITRDSPTDFIGAFMKYWNVWINELKELSYCKHIVLNSGKYLLDVL